MAIQSLIQAIEPIRGRSSEKSKTANDSELNIKLHVIFFGAIRHTLTLLRRGEEILNTIRYHSYRYGPARRALPCRLGLTVRIEIESACNSTKILLLLKLLLRFAQWAAIRSQMTMTTKNKLQKSSRNCTGRLRDSVLNIRKHLQNKKLIKLHERRIPSLYLTSQRI